jgi:hypothetical protein
MMLQYFRSTLLGAATVMALHLSAPAQACTDLPHICAQQQALEEMAGPPPKSTGDDGEPVSPYFDPVASRLSEVGSLAEIMKTKSKKYEEKMQDPVFAAFVERFDKGGWEMLPPHPDAKPGEYCGAFYLKGNWAILISGPGGEYKGAMLIFWKDGIPTPAKMKKVEVKLDQGDGSPQTVRVFNQRIPGFVVGSFAFAIPTIDDLLMGMEDEAVFTLSMPGYMGDTRFEWHDGLTARKEMDKCLSAGGRG